MSSGKGKAIRGGPPDYDRKAWLDDKFKVGLDFPNLPYFTDGDVKVTESKSIMKYIAKKWRPELLGRNALEVGHADMVSRVHDSYYGDISKHCKTAEKIAFRGED